MRKLGDMLLFEAAVSESCIHHEHSGHHVAIPSEMAIGQSGLSVGSFVIPFLAEWLSEEYGWRGTILVIAGLTLYI